MEPTSQSVLLTSTSKNCLASGLISISSNSFINSSPLISSHFARGAGKASHQFGVGFVSVIVLEFCVVVKVARGAEFLYKVVEGQNRLGRLCRRS